MIAKVTSTSLRLGIRAHDLGRFSADELARKVAAEGLDCVQLALGKAIEGLDLQPGVIDAGMAERIRAAFARHGVRIEVMGCYINPIHPDAQTRRTLLGLFKEHLRHAREFGCNIVALESGSLNADQSPHPGNAGEAVYQDLLGSMEELVAEAERCGVVSASSGDLPCSINCPRGCAVFWMTSVAPPAGGFRSGQSSPTGELPGTA